MGNLLVEVTVNSKEGNTLSQIRPRIRPLGSIQATSDAVESDGVADEAVLNKIHKN